MSTAAVRVLTKNGLSVAQAGSFRGKLVELIRAYMTDIKEPVTVATVLNAPSIREAGAKRAHEVRDALNLMTRAGETIRTKAPPPGPHDKRVPLYGFLLRANAGGKLNQIRAEHPAVRKYEKTGKFAKGTNGKALPAKVHAAPVISAAKYQKLSLRLAKAQGRGATVLIHLAGRDLGLSFAEARFAYQQLRMLYED